MMTMAFAPVGNLGNAADTTGYGAVGYAYSIGKYEVTLAQYTEFLNNVLTLKPAPAQDYLGQQSFRRLKSPREVLQLLSP